MKLIWPIILLVIVLASIGGGIYAIISGEKVIQHNGDLACKKLGYDDYSQYGYKQLCIRDGTAVRVYGGCGYDKCALFFEEEKGCLNSHLDEAIVKLKNNVTLNESDIEYWYNDGKGRQISK